MSADLTEAEALGHFNHWIGEASDLATAAVTDLRAGLRFVPVIKNAAASARAIALLRSDEAWLNYGKLLFEMSDLIKDRSMWEYGNLRWFTVAGKLVQVRDAVQRKYVAPRTGAVQSLIIH